VRWRALLAINRHVLLCTGGVCEQFYTDLRRQIGARPITGALSRRVAMSQLGQFRQYPEERDQPRRRVSIPWKFLSASPKASEYHLIDLATGVSHGGFDTLAGARQSAR
jgi:hypothetical protein